MLCQLRLLQGLLIVVVFVEVRKTFKRNLFDVIKYTLVMFARYKVIRDAGTQFSLCCLRTHAEWLTDWTTNPMHIAEALTSLKADRSYTSCDMSRFESFVHSFDAVFEFNVVHVHDSLLRLLIFLIFVN